jgi:hypothetical protein
MTQTNARQDCPLCNDDEVCPGEHVLVDEAPFVARIAEWIEANEDRIYDMIAGPREQRNALEIVVEELRAGEWKRSPQATDVSNEAKEK